MFETSTCFYVTIIEILNIFNTWTLKRNLWKAQTLFKKLEYSFLVESTKIEKATFPYKTILSEATIKTNRMDITKWTYHKERDFASNYFLFPKILRASKKELSCCTNHPNVLTFILSEYAGFLFEGTFSLWVSLS